MRLAELVTVFEALDDGRPVGIQIKGIAQLLQTCEHLQVLIRKQDEVRLIYLLNFAITLSKVLSIHEPEADAELLSRVEGRSGTWSIPSDSLRAAFAGV